MDRKPLLKDLIRERFHGNQAEFARAIGKAPAMVGQWLSGYRTLGDGTARHIEIKLGLGQGYFDTGKSQTHDPPIRDGPPTGPMSYAAIVAGVQLLTPLEIELLKAHVDFLYTRHEAFCKAKERAVIDEFAEHVPDPKKTRRSAA